MKAPPLRAAARCESTHRRSLLAAAWWWSFVAAAALLVLAARSASADPPAYLVLQAPAHKQHGKQVHGYYPGLPAPVSTDAYAYGWFGGGPVRKQKMRHHGFRQDYTQFSVR